MQRENRLRKKSEVESVQEFVQEADVEQLRNVYYQKKDRLRRTKGAVESRIRANKDRLIVQKSLFEVAEEKKEKEIEESKAKEIAAAC